MVKILVTGFGGGQCERQYASRSRLKILSSHYSLVNCLLDMGHQVDQRPVKLGEDLSSYDEIIVYLSKPREWVSGHMYDALYAISQHPKCILAFDDWQVISVYKAIEKVVSDGTLFHPRNLKVCSTAIDVVKPYEKQLTRALTAITNKQNRLLICAYSASHLNEPETYGVHLITDKFSWPRARVFTFNPNPYNRNRTWEDPEHYGAEMPDRQSSPIITGAVQSKNLATTSSKKRNYRNLEEDTVPARKKRRISPTPSPSSSPPAPTKSPPPPRPLKSRQFNFASLVQSRTQSWLKKQGLTISDSDDSEGIHTTKPPPPLQKVFKIGTFPVHLYGSRTQQQPRLTEDEMVRQITRDWGCLLPAYEHVGSGWWRNRVLQCADAGSVLVGDERELRVYYGDSYGFYGLTALKVTGLSERELRAVAAEQRRCLYELHSLDRGVQRGEVRGVLDADG